MTKTVPISAKRFCFHLQLYNKYQLLSHVQENGPSNEVIDAIDADFLKLPTLFKIIKNADIDVGCAYRQM
jgi:hypothetical protein